MIARTSQWFYMSLSYAEVEIVHSGSGGSYLDGSGTSGPVTIIGGAGSDYIMGGNAADVLRGGADGDSIFGNGGDDEIAGGDGNDNLYGGAGNDHIVGGAGNDWLNGNEGDDVLVGGDGDDVFHVSTGADTMIGGSGNDTVYHWDTTAGVTVNLRTGVDGSSRLIGIENVGGTFYNDVLEGNDVANTLDGNGGSDTLIGAGGDDLLIAGSGANLLDGGAGTDTVDFRHAESGMFVDLAAGVAYAPGFTPTSVLTGIENVTGSSYADMLYGDAGDNVLSGGYGDDWLDGGAGHDVAVFAGRYGDHVIEAATGGWNVSDFYWWGPTARLFNIEEIRFDDATIFIDGRNNAPIVTGPQHFVTDEAAAPVEVDLLAGISDFEGDPLSVVDVDQVGGPTASFSWTGSALTLDPTQFGDLPTGTALTLTFMSSVSDGTDTSSQGIVIEVRALSLGFTSSLYSGGDPSSYGLSIELRSDGLGGDDTGSSSPLSSMESGGLADLRSLFSRPNAVLFDAAPVG